MGMGITMTCLNCHEEDQLFWGWGYLGFNKVVYVCKRCGYWKQTETALDITKDKLDDNSGKDTISSKETIKEICPTCKIRMKKYEKYYKRNKEPLIPKMSCKKCGGLLKGGAMFCWD